MESVISRINALIGRHSHEEAEKEARSALDSGNLPPEYEARIRYLLGLAEFGRGNASDSIKEFRTSASLFRSSESAVSTRGLALAMTAEARAELACEHAEKSLLLGRQAQPLLERAFEDGDPRLASSLFSLSFAEYTTRHFYEAEALVKKAMLIWEKASGPEAPEVTTCLNNLGRICEETGRTDEGIELHRRALDIRIRTLGDHSETAFSMGNLGVAMASAGRWQEAADMLESALACYARCGQNEGGHIEGYRYNLNICRKALGAS